MGIQQAKFHVFSKEILIEDLRANIGGLLLRKPIVHCPNVRREKSSRKKRRQQIPDTSFFFFALQEKNYCYFSFNGIKLMLLSFIWLFWHQILEKVEFHYSTLFKICQLSVFVDVESVISNVQRDVAVAEIRIETSLILKKPKLLEATCLLRRSWGSETWTKKKIYYTRTFMRNWEPIPLWKFWQNPTNWINKKFFSIHF